MLQKLSTHFKQHPEKKQNYLHTWKKMAEIRISVQRVGWKHPQKMPDFNDWFNLENNIFIFKVIHSDTEVAIAMHMCIATAYKRMRGRNPNTIFTVHSALKLLIFFVLCLIMHSFTKKEKKKKKKADLHTVIPRPEDDKDMG